MSKLARMFAFCSTGVQHPGQCGRIIGEKISDMVLCVGRIFRMTGR